MHWLWPILLLGAPDCGEAVGFPVLPPALECGAVIPEDVLAEEDLGFDVLYDLIRRKGLRSVEEVLPYLPQSFRRHYTLMYESGSLQCASPENPRAVMHGQDARFIVTFNGDPSQCSYESLEIAERDDTTGRWSFYRLDFPIAEHKPEPNPDLCRGCHTKGDLAGPLRPNWDPYPVWRGAYGTEALHGLFGVDLLAGKLPRDGDSHDPDRMEARYPRGRVPVYERDHFYAFRERVRQDCAKGVGRYRFLVDLDRMFEPRVVGAAPVIDWNPDDPRTAAARARFPSLYHPVTEFSSHFSEPNLAFTLKLERLNFQSMVLAIMAAPRYEQIRTRVVEVLLCPGDVPDGYALPAVYMNTTGNQLGRLRALLEPEGISVLNWSMSRTLPHDQSFVTRLTYPALSNLLHALEDADPEVQALTRSLSPLIEERCRVLRETK